MQSTETSTPDPKAQMVNSLIGFLKQNEPVLKSFILSQQAPAKDQIAKAGPTFGGNIGTYTPVDPSAPVRSSDVAIFCTRIDRALEYSIDDDEYGDLYGVFTPSPEDASKFLMEAFSIVGEGLVEIEPMLDDFYKWDSVRKRMISSRVKVLVTMSMVSPAIRDRCDILQRDLQSILSEDDRSIKTMMMYVDVIYEATLKHINTELDRDVFYSVIARRKFSVVERKLRKYLWSYDESILANLVSIIETNSKELKDMNGSSERSAFESTLNVLESFLNEMHPLVLKNIRMDPQFLKNDVKDYISSLIRAYVPEIRSSDPFSDYFTFLVDSSTCETEQLQKQFDISNQIRDNPTFLQKKETVSTFVKSMSADSRSKIQSELKGLVSRIDGARVPVVRSVKYLVAMLDSPDASVDKLMDEAMSDTSEIKAFFAPQTRVQHSVKTTPAEAPSKSSWWKRKKEERKNPPDGKIEALKRAVSELESLIITKRPDEAVAKYYNATKSAEVNANRRLMESFYNVELELAKDTCQALYPSKPYQSNPDLGNCIKLANATRDSRKADQLRVHVNKTYNNLTEADMSYMLKNLQDGLAALESSERTKVPLIIYNQAIVLWLLAINPNKLMSKLQNVEDEDSSLLKNKSDRETLAKFSKLQSSVKRPEVAQVQRALSELKSDEMDTLFFDVCLDEYKLADTRSGGGQKMIKIRHRWSKIAWILVLIVNFMDIVTTSDVVLDKPVTLSMRLPYVSSENETDLTASAPLMSPLEEDEKAERDTESPTPSKADRFAWLRRKKQIAQPEGVSSSGESIESVLPSPKEQVDEEAKRDAESSSAPSKTQWFTWVRKEKVPPEAKNKLVKSAMFAMKKLLHDKVHDEAVAMYFNVTKSAEVDAHRRLTESFYNIEFESAKDACKRLHPDSKDCIKNARESYDARRKGTHKDYVKKTKKDLTEADFSYMVANLQDSRQNLEIGAGVKVPFILYDKAIVLWILAFDPAQMSKLNTSERPDPAEVDFLAKLRKLQSSVKRPEVPQVKLALAELDSDEMTSLFFEVCFDEFKSIQSDMGDLFKHVVNFMTTEKRHKLISDLIVEFIDIIETCKDLAFDTSILRSMKLLKSPISSGPSKEEDIFPLPIQKSSSHAPLTPLSENRESPTRAEISSFVPDNSEKENPKPVIEWLPLQDKAAQANQARKESRAMRRKNSMENRDRPPLDEKSTPLVAPSSDTTNKNTSANDLETVEPTAESPIVAEKEEDTVESATPPAILLPAPGTERNDNIIFDNKTVALEKSPEVSVGVDNPLEVTDKVEPASGIISSLQANTHDRTISDIPAKAVEAVDVEASSDASVDQAVIANDHRLGIPLSSERSLTEESDDDVGGPVKDFPTSQEEDKSDDDDVPFVSLESLGTRNSPDTDDTSVDEIYLDAPTFSDTPQDSSSRIDPDGTFGAPDTEPFAQPFDGALESATTVAPDDVHLTGSQESNGHAFNADKATTDSTQYDGVMPSKNKYEPSQPRMNVGTDFKPVKGGDLTSIDISDAVPVEATSIPVGERASEMDILIVNSILMTLEYARIYRSPQVLRLISLSKGQDAEKASFIGALQRATKKRVSFQFCKDILRMLFVDVTDFVEPDEIDPFEVRLFSEAQSDHTLTYERQLISLSLTPTGRKIVRADFYFSWMTRALEALQQTSAEGDLSLPFLSHFQREVTTRHANLSNYNKTVKALNSFNLQALQTASPAVLSYVKIRSEGQFWNERYKLGFLDAEADKKSLLVEFNNHNFSYYDHSSEDAMEQIQQHSHIQPVPSGPGKDLPQSWLLRPSDPYQYNIMFGPFTRVFGPKADNRHMAANCNEISDSLLDGNSVFLIGYGASGAGKTSTLICRSGSVECEDPGVVMYILRDKRMWSKYPIIRLSICELLAAGSDDSGIQKTIWKIEKIIFAFSEKLQSYISRPKQDDALSDIANEDGFVTLETVIQHYINVDRRTRGTTNNPSSSRSHVLVFLNLLSSLSKKDAVSLVIGDFAGVENTFKCDNLTEIQSIYNSLQCNGEGRCHRVYSENVVSSDRKLYATKQCGAGDSTYDLSLEFYTDNRTIAEKAASVYSFIDPATAHSSRQKLGLSPENVNVMNGASAVISTSEIAKSLLDPFATVSLTINGFVSSQENVLSLKDAVHDHFLDLPAGRLLKKTLPFLRANVDIIGLCVGIGLVYPGMKEVKSWFPIFQKFWKERPSGYRQQTLKVPPTTWGEEEEYSHKVSEIMNENPLECYGSGSLFSIPYEFNHFRNPQYTALDNIEDLQTVFNLYGEQFRSLYQSPDSFANKNGRVQELMSAVSVFLWAVFLDAISVREGSLQKLKTAVEICKCRSHEGRYINNALFQMRQAIRDIILVQQNDKGKLRTTPPFLDVCLPVNCSPYDTSCMEINAPPAALAETMTKLSSKADGIIPVILQQIGLEGMKTMKVAVFTLFLMSRKMTHDPPSPFIYAEGLRSEYARLSSSVAVNELCEKLLAHRYPPAKLAELKKSLAFYGLGGELEVHPKVVEQLKMDLEDQQHVLGRTARQLATDLDQMSARHNLETVKLVLTTIDNVNAVHPIGTLQFADSIAKYNLVERSCAYSHPFESPMMEQIHSKIAKNMKFTDAMNGLPLAVSAPGDVVAVHVKEVERIEKLEELEEARREKREAEEEARREREEEREGTRREREEEREGTRRERKEEREDAQREKQRAEEDAEEEARREEEEAEEDARREREEAEEAEEEARLEKEAAKQEARRMKEEEKLRRLQEKQEKKDLARALKGR